MKKKVHGIGISSVVPKLSPIYVEMAKKYFRQVPMSVSAELNLGSIYITTTQSLSAPIESAMQIAGYS